MKRKRFRGGDELPTITPRQALQGKEFAVVFDYGSGPMTYDTYLTRTTAERVGDGLNRRQADRHPGGSPYYVARIDFAHAES